MSTHETESERTEGSRTRRSEEAPSAARRETGVPDREQNGDGRGETTRGRAGSEHRLEGDSTDERRGLGRVGRLQQTVGNRAFAQAAVTARTEAAEQRGPLAERARTGPTESAQPPTTERSGDDRTEQSADRPERPAKRAASAQSHGSRTAGSAVSGRHSSVAGPRQKAHTTPVERAHAHGVQPKLTVGRPNDGYEREADAVATAVTTGHISAAVSTGSGDGPVRPTTARDADLVQTRTDGADPPPRAPAIASTVRSPGSGRSVPRPVRDRIEPVLGTSLGGVQVHSGRDAARAAGGLGARALTRANHIFLGDGESAHDVELMAHEATHVVQQGAAGDEPERAPAPSAEVQRLLPETALRKLNDWARYIPGWTLFTVLIGYNPLLGEQVDRTPTNLVEGLLSLVPFGPAIFDKLQELGILRDAFEWVTGELKRLKLSIARIKGTLEAAWDDISIAGSILGIGEGAVEVLERHFDPLLNDVESFAGSLVDRVVGFVEEAVTEQLEGLLDSSGVWSLFTKVLGRDPLRGEDVDASPTEILEDFLRLIGKEQHLQKMREEGVVTEAAEWIATQIEAFTSLLGQVQGLVEQLWETISPANIANLWANVRSFVGSVGSFLQRVWTFATTVAGKVLELVKDALVRTLQTYVTDNLPGFELLTVVLGRNPFTGERVPRTPETIMRGFITLLPGGATLYQKLAETGAIAQAGTRIQAAMTQLGITWEFVVSLFRSVWESLSMEALVEPVAAFQRIVAQFREPVSRLFSFVSVVLRELFSVVLQLMNFPTQLLGSIVGNAMQAITAIKQDPVGFLLNMLGAVKLGFQNFFTNILTYLGRGLADWLFRGLREAGVEPPTDLSLGSVLEFVLEVLGITMDRIWEKLAERIGQENVDRIRGAIDRLTGIWNFVADVRERGVSAIWEYVQEQITGLWDTVLAKAREWVMERVINRATRWLLSLLDPTGVMAVINGFSAFLSAVQSAAEYAVDILRIVNDYVSTIASVARGELAAGAAKLEQGLANAVPVAIGFLANQFGLGNIGEKIREIVASVRSVVDRAIGWLVDKAVSGVQSVLRALGIGQEEQDEAPATEADGTFVYETTEGGHTFRVTQNLQVFRFSESEQVTGDPRQQYLQKILEKKEPRVKPSYQTELGEPGRAVGPKGHIEGLLSSKGRPGIKTKNLPGYLPGDVRGHLIAYTFKGPDDPGNLVPMQETFNISTYGGYEGTLREEYTKKMDASEPVLLYMETKPHYDSDDASTIEAFRPSRITISGTIISLEATASGLEVTKNKLVDKTPKNPRPDVQTIDVNHAEDEELNAVLSPITFGERKFVIEAIKGGRPYYSEQDVVTTILNAFEQKRNIDDAKRAELIDTLSQISGRFLPSDR